MSDFIQVERDDSKVVRALQKLQAAVGDISPALLDIGEVLLESTKKRFETGTAPDGKGFWSSLGDASMRPRRLPGNDYFEGSNPDVRRSASMRPRRLPGNDLPVVWWRRTPRACFNEAPAVAGE